MRQRQDAFLGPVQPPPQIGHRLLLALKLGSQHLDPDPQDFLNRGRGCRWFLTWFRSLFRYRFRWGRGERPEQLGRIDAVSAVLVPLGR